MKIDNIQVTPSAILNCYKVYYPATYKKLMQNKFDYLELFGIRVSSCDTSLPDDLIGGMKVNKLNFWELEMSSGSTEPSPFWVKNPMSDAKKLGGAAFVAEGQYTYTYMGKSHGRFAPIASFCPTRPVKVYRWTPTSKDIENTKKGIPLANRFEQLVKSKSKEITVSKSSDVCIHRSWDDEKFYKDSAGCQILTNRDALNTIGDWADEHKRKKYGNIFQYTLFSKQQFISANSTLNPIFNLFKKLY